MRLLIFPAYIYVKSGYEVAVISDIKRLGERPDDIRVWNVANNTDVPKTDYKIARFSHISFRRFQNILHGYNNTELLPNDFSKIDLSKVDEIFCDEVIYYRAMRMMFPNLKLTVRFHNCFARIKDRVDLLGTKSQLSIRYRLVLDSFYKLERMIFQDTNVKKIFISNEDRDYYTSHFGRYNDSEVWGFSPDMQLSRKNRVNVSNVNKIVWYGGVSSHKSDSVRWFAEKIYPKLHNKYKGLEFHLYGSGTLPFNNPEKGIYGHGRHEGNSMPFIGESLYINPDTTGGGVKIKLLNYFESGLTFLTTPYGFEGYSKDLIDNQFCYVKEMDDWFDFIDEFLKKNS